MVQSSISRRWSPLVLLLVAATLSAALDCRKFVFAPQCRGIVAKRDAGSSGGAAALRFKGDFSRSGLSDLVPVDEDYQNAALDQDGGDDSISVAEALLKAYEDLSYSDSLSGALEEDAFLLRDPADYIFKQQLKSARPHSLRNPATHVSRAQQQHSRRQLTGQHQQPNTLMQTLLPGGRRANTRR